MRHSLDLIDIVYMQLPAGIAAKIRLDVEADAHFMRAAAIVTLEDGQVLRCPLGPTQFEGQQLMVKVPDTFIAQLCVQV